MSRSTPNLRPYFPMTRIVCFGILLATSGCLNRTPDLGLAPVTPPISIQSPVSWDTLYPGPREIVYSMNNVVNAVRFELYINDSLYASVHANADKKKPTIIWDVDTLLLDQRVKYSMAAYDTDGIKAESPVMNNILVTRSPTAPIAPDNLTLFRFGASSVNLTWDDRSTNENSYEVWKKISDGPYVQIQILPANSLSTNDSGIVDGVSYHYRIRAVNTYGYSDSKEAGIGADITVMNAPTNLSATGLGTKMILLQWEDNSSGELAFVIERRITSGVVYSQVGLAGPNETSFIDTTGLVPSSSYTYRVSARGQFEQSPWSNEESVLTLYIDTYAPSNLIAVVDTAAHKVNLAWKSNTMYDAQTRIERRPDPGGAFQEIGKVGTSIIAFSDTAVVIRSAYSYLVRVLSVDGHFTFYSNIASVALIPTNSSVAILPRSR